MAGLLETIIKPFKRGVKAKIPTRETRVYPQIVQLGNRPSNTRFLYKPTPRNLRYFGHTPFARRAINTIKNPIALLDWEITPLDGIEANSELDRQIQVVTDCFRHPNNDDSFSTFIEQLVEDFIHGAAATELQLSSDPVRPLWMYPVDGLSIQIFPGWTGRKINEPRYAQVIGYGTAFGGGTICELRNDELMYIRPNGSSATPFGFGQLEIAFNTINNLLGVAEFAGNVASNQRSSILLNLPPMGLESLEAFRSYWLNEIEGQGKVGIVAVEPSGRTDEKKLGGLEVHRLYPEGDAGMFLEYQSFLLRTIAAAFDISPQNLGLESDVNRNTAEVGEDRDWNTAIKPTASKIAMHLTRDAIHTKLGFSQLQFKWKGIEREDEQAQADIYATYYQNNATTPNENRMMRGQAPLENGEWGDMLYADVEIAIADAKAKSTAAAKPKPAAGKKK